MPATPACDFLRDDHRAIEGCLDSLLASISRLRRARISGLHPLVDRIRRLLAVHFEREERFLYPALRSHYPGLLARMQDQHEYIRVLEAQLAGMLAEIPAAPTRAWLEELRSCATEYCERVRNHASDEEEQLFRVAAACLRSDNQARITRRMMALRID